jgi:radical SAM protein with 4Fe4S-binding SPASM domain
MIVSKANRDHVYETGKLVAELGCQKLFATRTVPPERAVNPRQSSFHMEREETLAMLEQLLRVKQDFGLMIGTLVSYPLCLLDDLERFSDLVGRGCPAQSGHAMNISATGQCTPCVHQSNSNGNIFSEDIRTIYARMRAWHNGSYTHAACAGCPYLGICRSGCRSSANAYTGSLAGPDSLMIGPHHFSKHFELVQDRKINERIREGARLRVPERLRYRKEEGFYLLNIRWANTITCPESVAEKLIARIGGEPFTVAEIGWENAEILAQLYWKDALESPDLEMTGSRDKLGLSASIPAIAA